MFHPLKGQNIVLDGNLKRASWCPIRTGGCFFGDRPLIPDDSVSFLLNGTGGIEIGVIQVDPKTFIHNLPIVATEITEFQTVTEVKLHRRTCRISINLNTDRSEVISAFEGDLYKQTLNRSKDCWLAMDVKYGEVDVKIENAESSGEELKFSHIHGPNIKIWNDKSIVKSIEKSPAALCFYHTSIKYGMKIVLNCLPCPWHGTVPGRYYMKLVLFNNSPDELQDMVPSKFDVSKQDSEHCKELVSHQFSKEECTGEILINILENKLEIIDTSGTLLNLRLNDVNIADHWLGFELYGISVEIQTSKYEPISKRDAGGIANGENKLIRNAQKNSRFQASCSNTKDSEDVSTSEGETAQVDPYDLEANTRVDSTDTINLRTSIQSNFVYLVNNFEISDCLDYLVQAGITDIDELNRLLQMYEKDKKNARRQVLSLLSKKPISKKLFIDMLEHTSQMHLKENFFCDEPKD